MPPLSLPALPSGKPTAWEEAICAFLVEKRARSGRGGADGWLLVPSLEPR